MAKLLADDVNQKEPDKLVPLLVIFSKYLAELPSKSESRLFSSVFQLVVNLLKTLEDARFLLNSNYFSYITAFIRNQNHMESITNLDDGMDKFSRKRFLSTLEPVKIFIKKCQTLDLDKSGILLSLLNDLQKHEQEDLNINYALIKSVLEDFNDPSVLCKTLLHDELRVKPNLLHIWLCYFDVEKIGPKYIEITECIVRKLIHLHNIRVDFERNQAVHLGGGHLIPFYRLENLTLRQTSMIIKHEKSHVLHDENENRSSRCSLSGYSFNWLDLMDLLKSRYKSYLKLYIERRVGCITNEHSNMIKSIAIIYYILIYVHRKLSFDQIVSLNASLSYSPDIIMRLYETLKSLSVTVSKELSMKTISAIRENSFPKASRASEIDDFFGVCTTFCAALRHYLLRMSDEEINTTNNEGTHINPKKLIEINSTLLDVILGIINLSHPLGEISHQLTSAKLRPSSHHHNHHEKPKVFELAINVDNFHGLLVEPEDVNTINDIFDVNHLFCDYSLDGIMLSHKQRLDDQIFKKIMLKLSANNQVSSMMSVDSPYPEEDINDDDVSVDLARNDLEAEDKTNYRLFTIHRYCEAFSALQRIIMQIYLWHKRSEQILHTQTSLAAGLDDPRTDLWVRDNLVDLIVSRPELIISWARTNPDDDSTTSALLTSSNGGVETNPLVILAKSPFGYFSRYNRDLSLGPEMIRLIRQIIILLHLPFLVKYSLRNQILKALVLTVRLENPNLDPFNMPLDNEVGGRSRHDHLSLRIRRTHIYEDAFTSLSRASAPSIRPQLRVTFINEHKVEEIGYDGGGLSREFLTDLIATAFDPIRGLFLLTDSKEFYPALYPNPAAAEIYDNFKEHYFFLGRILGKALSMGMLLEIRFAVFFLAKIVSKSSRSIIDFVYLKTLDQDLYKNLKFLKNYEGNVEDLELDFTLNENMFSVKTIELIPNGASVRVTNENRLDYIHKVTNYKLNIMIKDQTDEFIRGLADVLCIEWLRIYDCFELQTLISGSNAKVDIDDLKKHTEYYKSVNMQSKTVEDFWQIVESFDQVQLRSLLRFVTGCSSPPMFGFENLHPPFTIHLVPELDRLPTASTCVNMLKMPDYENYNVLKEKLLYVINSKAGFDYS